MIKEGQIIKNLIINESVVIDKVLHLGSMVSISFTGVNSKKASSKILTNQDFANLEVLTEDGSFNFTGDPINFNLFAEAERISSAYQFDPLFAVNCSIVDPLPHQVEAVYKFLLPQPQIRFLLADDTGAGKTIMTGLLIKELLMRGLAERILIITPGGLTKQWQEDEMGIKFNMSFTLVNRNIFSSDPNIFQNTLKIVTSIDFISREDVLNIASNSHWDLIVFDECHKLSAYDYGEKQYLSQRYRAAEILAKQCEHLLLLTATPHRGRTDTFKKLVQLLDPDIFATDEIASARVKELGVDGINKFFIRRLKEDMSDWHGEPLFKERHTRTITYELTKEEKELYDAVTNYLTKRKEEANEIKNIHVSLALTVMQRRLVSSIFAIKNTLERRWKSLQGIADELRQNPNLWNQRFKMESAFNQVHDIDDFEDLEDEERDALEGILSDPKKFKFFTTAKSPQEIHDEAKEVKVLFEMAQSLYLRHQEEMKFQKLQELLRTQGVLDNGEKLVIFTEHKDTLIYLEERLSKNGGYKVVTIHGGKQVDERRQAQAAFATQSTQILIATDAAGEGINLQFCRLLINWDIPWNPNRLEQRMGRIHRYGQKAEVLVFNMVAINTKEGKVLERLLTKLDIIREGIGDDRVYDVIQDVLENVSLNSIINSVFNGQVTDLDKFLDQDNETLKIKFSDKIKEQTSKLAHSSVNFKDARKLKESSDEKRLQPIYIKLFFEKAFKQLGGEYTEIRKAIFRIDKLPLTIANHLKNAYSIFAHSIKQIQFCFDKQVFLEYQNVGDLGKVHYINPGNPIFDSLISVIKSTFRDDMLKGTVLVSPDAAEPYYAFFVRCQILDSKPSKGNESIADERLVLVMQDFRYQFSITSPAKFIDLHPPVEFTKLTLPPEPIKNIDVVLWSFNNVTLTQLEETKTLVEKDSRDRKKYLESSFTRVITDLQLELQELQMKLLLGDFRVQEKIQKKQQRIFDLILKRDIRLSGLELLSQLSPKAPEVLGCAYVIPLSQLEYQGHYGMKRDDEAEIIAMQTVMEYEERIGWSPIDVSADNVGFDIKSISPNQIKRYIEVKGRSGADGSVMLSENEMNRLTQLGDSSWLYIVINCKSSPKIHRIQNPAKTLEFQLKTKGVQYFLPMGEWAERTETK